MNVLRGSITPVRASVGVMMAAAVLGFLPITHSVA